MKYITVGTACLMLLVPFAVVAQTAGDTMRAQNVRVTKPKTVQSAFGSTQPNQQYGSTGSQAFSQNPSDQGFGNQQQSGQYDQGYQQNQNGASQWSPQQGQMQQQSPFAQDPNGYNQNNGGYQNYQNGQGTGVNSIAVPKNALQR
jgi:hypothetical protein